MGVAAYYRGNKAISAGICREYGCHGCKNCRPTRAPSPRPEQWGSKAALRARKVGASVLSAAEAYGLPQPPLETLAEVIRERAKVGKATALDAARHVLNPQAG